MMNCNNSEKQNSECDDIDDNIPELFIVDRTMPVAVAIEETYYDVENDHNTEISEHIHIDNNTNIEETSGVESIL